MSSLFEDPNASKGSLLKIGDAAALLHVNAQTLRTWTENGKIAAVISDSGHRKYYEADVKRLSLEEKGTTGYWTSALVVGMNHEGEFRFANAESYLFDNQMVETYFTRFSKYWDFKNGLQQQVHEIVLTTKTAINPSYDNSHWAFPAYTELEPYTMIAATAFSYSLDKEAAKNHLPQAVSEVKRYLKDNFRPEVTYRWFDKFKQNYKPE